MPRYLVKRSWERLDPDHMARVVRNMLDLATRFEDVRWLHSHPAVDEEGNLTTFCVYDSGDEDDLREHGLRTGHHFIDEVHEVIAEFGPDPDGNG